MAMKVRKAGSAGILPDICCAVDIVTASWGCRLEACAPGNHGFGDSTTVSFVAAAIAALLNGNARGVTLRQSSS